jgi:steroid delta-isomerase-like uncharacterized protein
MLAARQDEEHPMTHPLQPLLHRHLAAENAHDLAGTLATLHPDCLFEDTATGQVFHCHDGAAAHYLQWWNAFGLVAGRGPEDRAFWCEDGSCVAQAEFSGRHVGDFFGLAPTGREVRFRFAVFIGFRDGLMLSERFYYDLAGLMRQLGTADLPALAA